MNVLSQIIIMVSLFFAVSLCGCDSIVGKNTVQHQAILEKGKTPTGERTLERIIDEQSNGAIRLVKFDKINGTNFTFGIEFYILEYIALIEYSQDCWQVNDGFGTGFYVYNDYSDASSFAVLSKPIECKKGQQREISGELTFEKTENGWRISDAEL